MKKSLLIWGALIVIALCFVGCCYYNNTHHTPPCQQHCKHTPCCSEAGKQCPDDNDGEIDTVTVEAVEIVPLDGNAPAAQKPAAGHKGAEKPAEKVK